MFNNFTYYNPTRIYFGKGSIANLEQEIKTHNIKKILVVHEGPLLKIIGIDEILDSLAKKLNVELIDFPGMEPNPKNTHCDNGAELARKENVDLILAVGGGSVIDGAKAISLCAPNPGDKIYDYIDKLKSPKERSIRLGVILTSAATSSENSPALVISNPAEDRKETFFSEDAFPNFAICDPTYTMSLSPFQTASGAFDIFSHVIEQHMTMERFDAVEMPHLNIVKVLLKWLPIALKNPKNYEARANIMWSSTLALNGHGYIGKNAGWYAHGLSYPITSKWNIPHGASLALIMPYVLKYQLKNGNNISEFKKRISEIGKIAFNEEDPYKTIELLFTLVKEWGLYSKLQDYKTVKEIGQKDLEELSERGFLGHSNDSFLSTTNENAYNIYKIIAAGEK